MMSVTILGVLRPSFTPRSDEAYTSLEGSKARDISIVAYRDQDVDAIAGICRRLSAVLVRLTQHGSLYAAVTSWRTFNNSREDGAGN